MCRFLYVRTYRVFHSSFVYDFLFLLRAYRVCLVCVLKYSRYSPTSLPASITASYVSVFVLFVFILYSAERDSMSKQGSLQYMVYYLLYHSILHGTLFILLPIYSILCLRFNPRYISLNPRYISRQRLVLGDSILMRCW